jgi:AcrR family transcriptional regulator
MSKFSVFRVLDDELRLPFEADAKGTKENILMYSTILFAMYSYSTVSMRDIAAGIGIQAASLYNHFPSKEALWRAVVRHAERLYRFYHESLERSLASANSLEETLDIIFCEPEKMSNAFTCFAFSLIQSEQYRDEQTWRVYSETFVNFPISVIKNSFDRCIRLGYAQKFDTEAAATAILYFSLQEVNIYTQKLMGRETPHDPCEFMKQYHTHVLQMLTRE